MALVSENLNQKKDERSEQNHYLSKPWKKERNIVKTYEMEW